MADLVTIVDCSTGETTVRELSPREQKTFDTARREWERHGDPHLEAIEQLRESLGDPAVNALLRVLGRE